MTTGNSDFRRRSAFILAVWFSRVGVLLALLVAACASAGGPTAGDSVIFVLPAGPASPALAATATPGPTPSPTSTSTPTPLPTAAPPSARYGVSNVITADTFEVLVGGRPNLVRLIGVVAPQAIEPQRQECFGREAQTASKALVERKVVRMEFDPSVGGRDAEGRVPVYMWLPDDTFLNEVLVREGLAVVDATSPSYKSREVITLAQRYTQENGRGMWPTQRCGGYKPLPPVQKNLTQPQPQLQPQLEPKPAPTAKPSPIETPDQRQPGMNSCDASYDGVCIPSPPPVITCAQLGFKKFRVFSPDPHNFDLGRNGIGCE